MNALKLFSKIINSYKEAFSGLPRDAWLLALMDFINRSGTIVIFFMTLYLTQVYHYPTAKAGQVVSSFGLGALLGAYLGGKLTDRLGAYHVQKGSLLLEGILLIVLGQLSSYWMIMLTMFLAGVAAEAMLPSIGTAMSQICPPEVRTRGFALRRLSSNLGVTIGPILGGFLALVNYKLIFWLDGLTCLLAFGIALIFFKTARPTSAGREEAGASAPLSIWKDFFFLKILAVGIVLGTMYAQIFNTFPLYCRTVYGFRENIIGLLIAISTCMVVLFEMLLMHSLRNRPPLRVIAPGTFLVGLGLALMPLGRGFIFAVITVLIWTCGEMLTFPSLTSIVAGHSSDALRGKYLGLLGLSFSIGTAVGPAIGTRVYASFGPNVLWFSCGILGILLFFAVSTLKKK